MKIVLSDPPMIEEIRKVFPNRPQGVVYAFGDTIYYPGGKTAWLPAAVVQHEHRHGQHQRETHAEFWWRQYLEDPEFRYRAELLGHANEYLAQMSNDRNRNARLLTATAYRLLAPFYEYGESRPSLQRAIKDLRSVIAVEAQA